MNVAIDWRTPWAVRVHITPRPSSAPSRLSVAELLTTARETAAMSSAMIWRPPWTKRMTRAAVTRPGIRVEHPDDPYAAAFGPKPGWPCGYASYGGCCGWPYGCWGCWP